MRDQTDPRMCAESTRDDGERWLDDVDRLEEDWPTEDLDLGLLDDEYDDLWLEPDESDRAEHRRRSDAEWDDELDEEWNRRRRRRKPRRDHRRRVASGSSGRFG